MLYKLIIGILVVAFVIALIFLNQETEMNVEVSNLYEAEKKRNNNLAGRNIALLEENRKLALLNSGLDDELEKKNRELIDTQKELKKATDYIDLWIMS